MELFNDESVLIDELNLLDFVREITNSIVYSKPPQVFGIHGDWGSGKTTLIQLIQLALSKKCGQKSDVEVADALKAQAALKTYGDKDDDIKVVWFEAWRYQNEPVPIVALLHEMRQQLSWQVKATGSAKKLAEVAIRGSLLSIEELTKLVGIQAKVSKIEQAGKDWEREHLASRLPSSTIRDQLEHAISGLLAGGNPTASRNKKKNRRVVVLIDDLDRCEPEAAYRLLEGLKIYLTLPSCVFVLAMNQRIVEDAIAKHIPVSGSDSNHNAAIRKERAAAYVEKLCQNIWRMPVVTDPKSYLCNLLTPDHPHLAKQLDLAIGDINCLPPNPRRIKSVANLALRLNERIDSQTRTNAVDFHERYQQELRQLLVVALIHRFHHDIYRRWVHQPKFYEKIRTWAESSSVTPLSQNTSGTTDNANDTASRESWELLFDHLQRTVNVSFTNQSGPTPSDTVRDTETAHPDPAESNVCWAQELIVKLGPVDPEVFEKYLDRTT